MVLSDVRDGSSLWSSVYPSGCFHRLKSVLHHAADIEGDDLQSLVGQGIEQLQRAVVAATS